MRSLATIHWKTGIRPLTSERGIALFLVLWVLMLLSVIVGEFCYAMRTGTTIAFNFRSQAEGYYIALAGIHRGVAEMIRNTVVSTVKLQKAEREDETEEPRWRVNAHIPPVTFGKGKFEVTIENESGKVNINRAGESELKMVLGAFDLDESERDVIVDSILDWRDPNDLHRVNGAEDEYYRSLPEPYDCKDADFDSIDELLLVRGVTPALFYGGLRDMVTVFGGGKSAHSHQVSDDLSQSSSSNLFTSGSNKININAASRRMLLSLPKMTDEVVQKIMDYRKESDFKSLNEVASVVGYDIYPAISPFIGLDLSPYYTVSSVGKVDGTSIRQGLWGVFEIKASLKKGYKVVQWHDGFEYAGNGDSKE
jgi:general secretion pathway protein K